jgi:thiol-disulfide isomerase/thioredoxin
MKTISGIEELDEFIIDNYNNDLVVLLYFGAKWCGPCKQLKNRLDEQDTIKIMPKLVVGYLDVDDDENSSFVKKYKIDSLPTQIYIKLNENKVIEISRIEGYDFTKLKLNYDNYFISA